MLVKYTGVLGEFEYDTADWLLDEDRPDPEFYALRYVGVETDGSRIAIPKGLKSGFEAFKGCIYLLSPPLLPEGLENGSRMFVGCEFLRTPPVLPHSLKYAYEMFKGCASLASVPVIPDSLVICHHMFEGTPDYVRDAGMWCIGHRGESYDNTLVHL